MGQLLVTLAFVWIIFWITRKLLNKAIRKDFEGTDVTLDRLNNKVDKLNKRKEESKNLKKEVEVTEKLSSTNKVINETKDRLNKIKE